MLSPVEKLNVALRENRPEEYVRDAHREIGLKPVQFGPGTSEWEWFFKYASSGKR